MERREDGEARAIHAIHEPARGKAGAMTRTEDNDTFSRPRTDLMGSPCRIRQHHAAVRQGYDETADFGLKYFARR